jgi:tetratricopeptide (TPR) repeat protein
MENLEYAGLIEEARNFIQEASSLQGNAARPTEALLNGRLGELLFHSGKAAEAIEPFRIALQICREIKDVEGQLVYFGNLLEMHRYQGEIADAVRIGEDLVSLMRECGQDTEPIKKLINRIATGEPLCRIVCCRNGKEMELDEISQIIDGKYEFQFRRNRLSLLMTGVLVRQGNQLASSGMHADALEKYQAAMEVDSYDPDPVYQCGVCLLELGAYGKAREAFEEVERLAPAWFWCRSDRWLAEQLEAGNVTDDEFRLLRVLDDGNLSTEEAIPIAEKATKDYPEFAPFSLNLGNLYHNQGEKDKALACYRRGLDLVAEPDLESRLLCAAAGILQKGSKERLELVKRAVTLKGNLVAQATAKLLGLP